jgi:hypothetical protein
MPTLYVNDVIQFRPQWGCARIVTITGLGPDGFTGVLTANKVDPVIGRYEQVLRILKRADPDVDHKTKTVGVGDNWVAWVCRCEHSDMGTGDDTEAAMRNARVQQEMHRREMRSDD